MAPTAKKEKLDVSSTQLQQNTAWHRLSAAEKNKFLGHMTHYILSAHTAKGAVKIEELKKAEVIPKELLQKNVFSVILKEVTKVFRDKFALKLDEVQLNSSNTSIVLTNMFDNSTHINNENDDAMETDDVHMEAEPMMPHLDASHIHLDTQQAAKQALLMNALSFLFMTDPRTTAVPSKHLENYFEKLGVDLTKQGRHPTFGDVKKLINTTTLPGAQFVRQGWLEVCETEGISEQKEYNYSWGPRAHKTIPKMNILKLACRILNRPNNTPTRPEHWVEHFAVAQQQLRAAASS